MSEARTHAALRLVVAVLAILCTAGLWRAIAVIGLHVPTDPNEGWNAYHAVAAMAGGPLYPGPHSFMINNYPPLSFYLVGGVAYLLGDAIVAGRIVSLLALGVIAFGLFTAARRMGCKPVAASFAPLFFVGGLLVFTDYVGMDDPQMLAHAIAVAGFLIVLREPRETLAVGAAALLFVLAAFVKHNVIAMALAMTVWLVLYDRRRALQFVLFGLAFLLAGLAIFRLVYGTGLLAQLGSARSYSLTDLRSSFETWLTWGLIPLVGLGFLGFLRQRDRYVQFCVIYAAVGVALGVSFLGGAGVDANVMFDADIALALSGALLLDRIGGAQAALAATAYAAPLLLAAWSNSDWHQADYWLHPMREETRLAKEDIGFLATRRGAALCEMQSFCYWAGKPAAVDVFNVGQQFETGTRSDAALVGMIEACRFAAVQFDPDSPYSLGEGVHDAMVQHYRLDHTDDFGAFYVPK